MTDNLFEVLAQEDDSGQWAFGTGFTDEFARIDRTAPAGVDRSDLVAYCLMLGDDSLVAAQRMAEWCSRGPELEEDIALANIALDLLGHARALLARAAELAGDGRDADGFAFFREAADFRNVGLVEPDLGPGPGGDFASTMARLLVFSTWRLAAYQRLTGSREPVIAGVAAKGAKELAYHREHAVLWVLRLAGGTDHSRSRMIAGLEAVWPYLPELFEGHQIERRLAAAGIAVDPAELRDEVVALLREVLRAAGLDWPQTRPVDCSGRAGRHTPELAALLAEMQSVARAMPGARW